jgi:hypothetical protein
MLMVTVVVAGGLIACATDGILQCQTLVVVHEVWIQHALCRRQILQSTLSLLLIERLLH